MGVKFSDTPLKEVPVFTNCAKPASCSGVEMSNEVWLASYHVTSAVPSQTVCADRGAAAKPSVTTRRAAPGIMDSVSAGQIANAPPTLAIARTAARIHLWNSM